MQRVINFSGGRSSAYMTILEYKPGDIVIFCDTGREHDKTYKFLNDFEAFEKIPIVRIGGKSAFRDYLKKRDFDHIPNMMKRSCTIELKIKPARRYLRSLGLMQYENLIGFRSDEPERVLRAKSRWQKVVNYFPLYNRGIDERIVLDYWSKKPYNLEIPGILGNCVLCFMKGKNAVISILREYPEIANEWIEDEELSKLKYGHTYFNGVSIRQLRDIAQGNLFKEFGLDYVSPAFDCSCHS